MVIHFTNIYNDVVFPGKKACIFRFKGRKSCANGDSVTLEFMLWVATRTKKHCHVTSATLARHSSTNIYSTLIIAFLLYAETIFLQQMTFVSGKGIVYQSSEHRFRNKHFSVFVESFIAIVSIRYTLILMMILLLFLLRLDESCASTGLCVDVSSGVMI